MDISRTPPGPRPLRRREFLSRAGAGGLVIGLGAVAAGELAPAALAATAFGYTSSGGYFTVSTGRGPHVQDQTVQRRHDVAELQRNRTAGSEFVLAGRVRPGHRRQRDGRAERQLHHHPRVGHQLVRQRHARPLPRGSQRPEQRLPGYLRELRGRRRAALDLTAQPQRDFQRLHPGGCRGRHGHRVHRH
jgi:hypothetical protein